MAKALQHDQAALGARVSTAGTADVHACNKPSRWDIADAGVSIPLVQKIHQVIVQSRPKRCFAAGAVIAKNGQTQGSIISTKRKTASATVSPNRIGCFDQVMPSVAAFFFVPR
jgi:hypothetical protein